MTRVAAIDCGTNAIRLLVADVVDGSLTDLDRRMETVRLGEGVDATGRLADAALARTFAACERYAAIVRDLGAERIRFVATSASRDAENRDVFVAGVLQRIGVEPEVISGDEEAQLSFDGALAAVPDAAWPTLVMDVGGGSTELVLGSWERPARGVSLDIGSVRLRERFLASDPPSHEEITEASEFIDDLLDASGVDFDAAATWIGVGGTATALSAIAQGLGSYDRARVHGSVVTRDDLAAWSARLLSLPVADVLRIPTMVPGRADVICGGALIVHRIGARLGVDLRVSEADILDGIVAALAIA